MQPVIILLGPTGVGKTGASILLAQHLNTEIISADSMQIYKGMDIGTAKPTYEEQAIVRHHMIDVASTAESFSAGKYRDAIIPIIARLHEQGKVPLIVGGTGLYIRAITRGIFSGPSADWTLREELLAIEEEQQGALYEYLMRLDPEAAAKIAPNDTRRVVRSLEVCIKAEGNISELQRELTSPLPYDFIRIGLTRDRKELYPMIEQRVDAMIDNGLVNEVRRLLEQNPDRTPLQAIGYKEIAGYLQGEIPFEEAVRLVKRNTKRYAKRQFTWFKKEEGIRWIDVTGIHDSQTIFMMIRDVIRGQL